MKSWPLLLDWCAHCIRVYKNIWVCSDCHAATKFISKVTGREIVARDARRFHHLKDGSTLLGITGYEVGTPIFCCEFRLYMPVVEVCIIWANAGIFWTIHRHWKGDGHGFMNVFGWFWLISSLLLFVLNTFCDVQELKGDWKAFQISWDSLETFFGFVAVCEQVLLHIWFRGCALLHRIIPQVLRCAPARRWLTTRWQRRMQRILKKYLTYIVMEDWKYHRTPLPEAFVFWLGRWFRRYWIWRTWKYPERTPWHDRLLALPFFSPCIKYHMIRWFPSLAGFGEFGWDILGHAL